MKKSKTYNKVDVAHQTISAVLLYLDDKITSKEFDKMNQKLLRAVKSRVRMPRVPLNFESAMFVEQFS